LNQSEPNVILTAHVTKVNRTEPNWTEPQTCLACRNHAFSQSILLSCAVSYALSWAFASWAGWFSGQVGRHVKCWSR